MRGAFGKVAGVLAGLALGLAGAGAGEVDNRLWPWRVEEDGPRERTRLVGPLVEEARGAPERWAVLRPLYLGVENAAKQEDRAHTLYPLVTTVARPGYYRWSLLQALLWQTRARPERPPDRRFTVFPFVFWRDTGEPESSYAGVFPVAGQVRQFLFYDAVEWAWFPLYANRSNDGATRHYLPFPFIQWERGGGADGWAVWPLMGHFTRSGRRAKDFQFAFWPLVYRRVDHLEGEWARTAHGVLPFYALERTPKVTDWSFAVPLLGWRREKDPEYRETRYLWPLWVQGRGRQYINRWLPFYAHSVDADGDSERWVLFPLLNQVRRERGERALERTRVLYFFIQHERTTATAPGAETAWRERFSLWPLLTVLETGSGLKQVQALSPLAPLLPGDAVVRRLYSPLFALFRYERRGRSYERHSLLWDFLVHERTEAGREVRAALLLNWQRREGRVSWELLGGLLGYRDDGEGGQARVLWLDLPEAQAWGNVGRPEFGPRR